MPANDPNLKRYAAKKRSQYARLRRIAAALLILSSFSASASANKASANTAVLTTRPLPGVVPQDAALTLPRPSEDWRTLRTPHFNIHFKADTRETATIVADIAEAVFATQVEDLQWRPKTAIEVVLLDSIDASNGGATVLPYNRFYIYLNPPAEGQLQDQRIWLEQVFIHELVHILHLDQVQGLPADLQSVFGRLIFLFPQIFSPTWLTEGIAVYEETDAAQGFGRGQSALYAGMMRAEQQQGFQSLAALTFHGTRGTDWPSDQSYLYGYYFFEFLHERHGSAAALRFVRAWNTNLLPWQLNARARAIGYADANALWQDFTAWLTQRFEEQPTRAPSEIVAADALQQHSPVWTADGSQYFVRNDGHTAPTLEHINAAGEQQTVTSASQLGDFAVHPEAGIVASRAVICNNTEVFSDLFRWQQGRWHRLTHCGRYPRLTWSPAGDKIAAVQTERGRNRLVILNAAGDIEWQGEWLAQGQVIGALSWDPQQAQIAAAVQRGSGWNLELVKLDSGEWQPLTADRDLQSQPQWSRESGSQDGAWLYFLSDREGVLNVERLNPDSGQRQIVSRTDTAVLDFAVHDKRLLLEEYTATGTRLITQTIDPWADTTVPVSAAAAHHIQSEAQALVQGQDENSASASSEAYSPWSTLRPRAWFFNWRDEVDSELDYVQVFTQGQDVLNWHTVQLAPTWYLQQQELGGEASWLGWHRLGVILSRDYEAVRNDADTLTAVDEETRTQLLWMQPFNGLESTWYWRVGVAREELTRRWVGTNQSASLEDNLLGFRLGWRNDERFRYSISSAQGREITAGWERYNPLGDSVHRGEVVSLDWREYVPLGSSQVLALRAVVARADRGAQLLELGGEVDAWQTLGERIGLGQRRYPLRGYETGLTALSGTDLDLLSVEYRRPLGYWYNGRLVPPVGLGRASISVFADTGRIQTLADDTATYTGVGFELRPEVLVGYPNLGTEVVLGVAQGLDSDLGTTQAYLRVGFQF